MKQLCLCFFLGVAAAGLHAQTTTAAAGSPIVLGVQHQLQSAVLGEQRALNIYLPEGYDAADSVRYPVVYLLDGGLDEDFIHIAGLYQFNSFSWVKRVPPSIVVGIVNVQRQRDFTFASSFAAERNRYPASGHADRFIQFLHTELQPYIEKQYKTTADKTLIGESLGGLLAAAILLKQPAMFNRYIIVSPSLWWDGGSLLQLPAGPLKAGTVQPTQVYIGVGKEGLTPGELTRVMEVDANLLAEKITQAAGKAVQVYFDYLPQENHANIMHQAVMNALLALHAMDAPAVK